MIPIDQTTFGFPGGNCFSACIASMLELSLDDVPYFMGDKSPDENDTAWYDHFAAWLKPRGFYPLCFQLSDAWRPLGLHVLSGRSPRAPDNKDWLHCVVADGEGNIVHDPHPSRAGLHTRTDVVMLVPFDPSELKSNGKTQTPLR